MNVASKPGMDKVVTTACAEQVDVATSVCSGEDEQNTGLPMSDNDDGNYASTGYRTVAYTIAASLLCFWMGSINSIMWYQVIEHGTKHEKTKEIPNNHRGWVITTRVSSMLISFFIHPLAILLPPIFQRSKTRLWIDICISVIGMLMCVISIGSAVIWASLVLLGTSSNFVTDLALHCSLTLVVFLCFLFNSIIRMRRFRRKTFSTDYNQAVNRDNIITHISSVGLIFASSVLNASKRAMLWCRLRY